MTDLTGVGTFTEYLIPEPDSPLTLDWGVALAQGLNRAMTIGTYEVLATNLDLGGEATFALPHRFSAPPLLKLWAYYGTTWYDYEMVGTQQQPYLGGGISFYYLENGSMAIRVGISITNEAPTDRTVPTWLLAYGK